MRSELAESLRAEDREAVSRMSDVERIQLALRLGDEAIDLLVANEGVSRNEAIRRIRDMRQRTRRRSRCMGSL